MRAINAQFELFDGAHVPVGSRPRERGMVRSCPVGGITMHARKYKNSGNEAKKYLKTKDLTILDGANYVRFCAPIDTNWTLKEHETSQLAKTNCNEGVERLGRKGTHCRLEGAVREPPPPASRTVGWCGRAVLWHVWHLAPDTWHLPYGLTLAFGNLIILLRLIKWSVPGKQGGEGAQCNPPP